MAGLGEAFVQIRAKFDQLDKDLGGAKKMVTDAMKGIAVASAAALAGAGLAVGKFAVDSVKEFASFQQGMNEVFTLLPGMSQTAMDKMSDDVLKFSTKFGTLPEKVIPALYQAISAGVPPDNVFTFLETSQKAAIGGVTDLTTAIDGISSVVNAYGKDVINEAKAGDIMFTGVKQGKTTFNELSKSLFQVIPTAASLGVEFGDITAALASMTSQGVPTSVATTQLRQLLVELSKDGSEVSDTFKEVAGVGFADFIAKGGTLQEALKLMEEHAAGANLKISDMFGSVEAGNAALALTGPGADTFTKNLAAMQGSAGAATEAFNQMDGGIGRAWERAQALWSSIQIGVGGALEPLITKLMDLGERALPFIQEVMKEAKPVISAFAERFGTELGPALQIIGDSLRRIADTLGITNKGMTDAEAIAVILGKGLGILTTALESSAIIMKVAADIIVAIGPAIKPIVAPVWQLVDAWKALSDAMAKAQDALPDWATPGSPTPLEIGVLGIGKAFNMLPDISSKFDFKTPAFAGAGGLGGGGNYSNSATVNIGSVSATSTGGNPADEAIKMTFRLLREQLSKK